MCEKEFPCTVFAEKDKQEFDMEGEKKKNQY